MGMESRAFLMERGTKGSGSRGGSMVKAGLRCLMDLLILAHLKMTCIMEMES